MRFLSSNEADWERRHPVTLLFFLFSHLFILTYIQDVTVLVIGLVLLLILERRFPWTMLIVLIAFAVVSVFPALFGWELSLTYIWRQLLKLATFLLGMLWISRIVRLERLLPLLSKWPVQFPSCTGRGHLFLRWNERYVNRSEVTPKKRGKKQSRLALIAKGMSHDLRSSRCVASESWMFCNSLRLA